MAASPNAEPHLPTLVPPWQRICEDSQHHFNDFCLFRDQQDVWHAIGIMGEGTWDSETRLFHYAGKTLDAPYEEHPPLFTSMPDIAGMSHPKSTAPQKHCPFVLLHGDRYHMFYRRPWGCILHVRTHDPFAWPDEATLAFEEADARDPCVLEHQGRFLMYYCRSCDVEGVPRSCVYLRESNDLDTWSEGRRIFYDPLVRADHSLIESPFVLKRREGWYLFYRDRTGSDMDTPVYFSHRHDAFENPPITTLIDCHAAEIVSLEEMHYIARASGPIHGHPSAPSHGGWLDVAPLAFHAAPPTQP